MLDISMGYAGTNFSLRDERFHIVELHLQDLTLMDKQIQEHWEEWVADAPRAWHADGWLNTHQPISVTCKFGQDQLIGEPEQAAAWQQE